MVGLLLAVAAASPLAYADYLYGEGEFFRASGEYHRYLFEHPGGDRRDAASLGLGWCYLHGGRNAQAERAFQAVSGPYASYGLARAYLAEGRRDEALAAFGRAGSLQATRLELARLSAEAGRWREAAEGFEAAGSAEGAKASRGFANRRALSPVAAGLAGVVPGGGYLYAGRPWDAFSGLVVTGALGSTAYYYLGHGNGLVGGGFAGLTGIFWAGSIYGGVRETLRANERAEAAALDVVRRVADAPEPRP